MSGKAINLIIMIVIGVFALGLIITIITAYWLWLALIAVAGVVLRYGVPVAVRMITTRTYHR